jgi:hypothetical protein
MYTAIILSDIYTWKERGIIYGGLHKGAYTQHNIY